MPINYIPYYVFFPPLGGPLFLFPLITASPMHVSTHMAKFNTT